MCVLVSHAEFVYDDIFSVWETIWAAKHVSSAHYILFIALALVEVYVTSSWRTIWISQTSSNSLTVST